MKLASINYNTCSNLKLNFCSKTNDTTNVKNDSEQQKKSTNIKKFSISVLGIIASLLLIDIIFNKSKILKRIFNNTKEVKPEAPKPKPEGIKPQEINKGFKFEINEDNYPKGTYFAVYHPDGKNLKFEKKFDKIVFYNEVGEKVSELIGNPDKLSFEDSEKIFEIINTKINDRLIYDKKITLKTSNEEFFLRKVFPIDENSKIKPYTKLSICNDFDIKSLDKDTFEFIKRDSFGYRTIGKYNQNSKAFEIIESKYENEIKNNLNKRTDILNLLENTTTNIINIFKEIEDLLKIAIT